MVWRSIPLSKTLGPNRSRPRRIRIWRAAAKDIWNGRWRARVRVVVDIGYGDATEPGLNDIELPVLLDQPAPNLRAYPYETVVAEKFQAMVALGLANTRLKDFYDIWILAQT